MSRSITPESKLVGPIDVDVATQKGAAAIATGETGGEELHNAYLVELGQRVRQMRAMRGMSRKVLSQVSSISERYIAQLESGLGNVSVILLRRVAAAIGVPIEDLVAEQPLPKDWAAIRSLLRGAGQDQIDQVKAMFTGEAADRRPCGGATVDRIALIGLRGAGKSTLGRMASEALNWPFIELNRAIEEEHGLAINEILSLYGHEGYHRLEFATLRKVVARPGPMILATGGGIVSEAMNFELLLSSFFAIWLKASPAEHMSRVRNQGDFRPMANDDAAMAELVAILTSREPAYARARLTIDTSGVTPETSLRQLLLGLQSFCISGCFWQTRAAIGDKISAPRRAAATDCGQVAARPITSSQNS